MWSRAALKQGAKFRLRGKYLISVLVCLFVSYAPSVFLILLPRFDINMFRANPELVVGLVNESPLEFISMLLLFFCVNLIISLFVVNPLRIGLTRYFIHQHNGEEKFSDIFFAFKNGYFNVVWVMLLRDIIISLWSLLLFIPGVIKMYQYFFLDYILAENPRMKFSEVKREAFKMSHREVFNLFVLNMSFIGWMLLATLVFAVIGGILVMPYMTATFVCLYEYKKQNIDTV